MSADAPKPDAEAQAGAAASRASIVGSHAEEPRASMAGSHAEEPRASTVGAHPASRAASERIDALERELAAARAAAAQNAELAARERRFRRIVETTAEGVWTIDAEGATTFVNAAMAGMLGYSAEQMLGRQPSAFLSPENQILCEAHLRAIASGQAMVDELGILHADGHEVWCQLIMNPLFDAEGRVEGGVAMITDASDKRRREREQSEVTERMVESQRIESLGVLAGGIAHDFNNLLAAIMGHAEIAAQEPGLMLRSRAALANAMTAAQRAAGLTRQLLDYSGRSQVELRPLRLGAQTAEMVQILRASIPKRIAIELEQEDPALAVMADPDRLQQATMNLVLNAAESYGTQNGTVSVRIGRATLSAPPRGAGVISSRARGETARLDGVAGAPGDYVFLEVRDAGAGMDEQTLKRVFDPFFTTKNSGRGLGLAATIGIVRTHGGHVTVQSKLGEGTTFRLWFPRCTEVPVSEAPPSAALPSAEQRARTLLVVDDEPMVREFAQRLLETEGYQVIEAGTGSEALAMLRARLAEIDGVLLDLSMPGMDGDTLLSELRAFAPRLPVIVHSGHSLETTSERLTQWNIAGVLQKPYRAARLSEMVRSVFGMPAAH